MIKLSKKSFLVVPFASHDRKRSNLNGVTIEPDGTTIATDGRSMAMVSGVGNEDELKDSRFIMLDEAERLAEFFDGLDVMIDSIDGSEWLSFNTDPVDWPVNVELRVLPMMGSFKLPDYRTVIPNTDRGYVEIHLDPIILLEALQAIVGFSEGRIDHETGRGLLHLQVPDDRRKPIVLECEDREQRIAIYVMPVSVPKE